MRIHVAFCWKGKERKGLGVAEGLEMKQGVKGGWITIVMHCLALETESPVIGKPM